MTNPTVLIVDDSPMMLRFAAGVLGAGLPAEATPKIVTARRANEGLLRAGKTPPDLVLLNFELRDMNAVDFCQKLLSTMAASGVPAPTVIAMLTAGADPRMLEAAREHAEAILQKPFTPEILVSALEPWLEPAALQAHREKPLFAAIPVESDKKSTRQRARLAVPPTTVPAPASAPAPPRAVFRGVTPKFSLRSAVRTAVEDKLTGVLHLYPTRRARAQPAEVFVRDGAIAMVTTREAGAYAEGATFTAPLEPATVAAAVQQQSEIGCPFPILLQKLGLLEDNETTAMCQELGQRLFARLWTLPRLPFEFEALSELPPFVSETRQADLIEVDDWLLETLRRVRHDELPDLDVERFDGVPAYTREGYELIPRLHLTEAETEFAAQVNGRTDLGTISRDLGLAPTSALLILFRFRSVELMDYWPAALLTRPAATAVNASENTAPRNSAATLARQIAAQSPPPKVRVVNGDPGVTRINMTPRLLRTVYPRTKPSSS